MHAGLLLLLLLLFVVVVVVAPQGGRDSPLADLWVVPLRFLGPMVTPPSPHKDAQDTKV